jgi:hypothetical protein
MDPKKLVTDWSKHIISEAVGDSSATAFENREPMALAETTLFDLIPADIVAPRPVLGPPVGPVDEFGHALAELGRVKPLLLRLSGDAYMQIVVPAWDHYQKTKDPAAFIKVVKKLVDFDRLVRRAYRMLPTLRLNCHPRVSEVAQGLREGALVDAKLRHEWQEVADLCWREFIQRAGPFGREIAEEIP